VAGCPAPKAFEAVIHERLLARGGHPLNIPRTCPTAGSFINEHQVVLRHVIQHVGGASPGKRRSMPRIILDAVAVADGCASSDVKHGAPVRDTLRLDEFSLSSHFFLHHHNSS